MPRLIKKFSSTLSASQQEQVNNALSEGVQQGKILSREEFQQYLDSSLSELRLTATPTAKIRKAIGGVRISSFEHDEDIGKIEGDLAAVYNELDNIQELLVNHNVLFENKILDINNEPGSDIVGVPASDTSAKSLPDSIISKILSILEILLCA